MFTNILCATNLNDTTSEAVKKAVQLAHQYSAKIFMLNVHEEFMTKEEMRMLRVSIDTMKSEFVKTALQAKNEMKKVIKNLHAEDIQVEVKVENGDTTYSVTLDDVKLSDEDARAYIYSHGRKTHKIKMKHE